MLLLVILLLLFPSLEIGFLRRHLISGLLYSFALSLDWGSFISSRLLMLETLKIEGGKSPVF